MRTYNVWTYYGITIYREVKPGYRLPYSACIDGLTAHADTLAGIKRLIRAAVK